MHVQDEFRGRGIVVRVPCIAGIAARMSSRMQLSKLRGSLTVTSLSRNHVSY